jgi:hypothetical protein
MTTSRRTDRLRAYGVLFAAATMSFTILLLCGPAGVSHARAAEATLPSAAASPSSLPPVAAQPSTAPAASPSAAAGYQTVYWPGRGFRGRSRRGMIVYQAPYATPLAAAAGAAPRPDLAGQPAAAAKSDPYAWKDLFDGKTLGNWKSAEFGGEGKVYVKDGMIVMEMGNNMTGVTWTGEVPRDDYELTFDGMRLEGSDFFCSTTFPVGKNPCTLVVGGWGGTVVGLSNVDYYDASDNPTSKFMSFDDKRWYHVRIRLTTAKIEAWLDDEQVVDQPRADHKFDIRMECDLCQPLGICTWCTEGAVRNIRLRQLPPGSGPISEADDK